MSEEVTYRIIPTTDPMFSNRGVTVYGGGGTGDMKLQSYTPVPDTVVLCNGCNANLYPRECSAVYFDGRLYDVYCWRCRERYFPKAVREEVNHA